MRAFAQQRAPAYVLEHEHNNPLMPVVRGISLVAEDAQRIKARLKRGHVQYKLSCALIVWLLPALAKCVR